VEEKSVVHREKILREVLSPSMDAVGGHESAEWLKEGISGVSGKTSHSGRGLLGKRGGSGGRGGDRGSRDEGGAVVGVLLSKG